MKFANGICIITEDVPKLPHFYEKILQIKIVINDMICSIPSALCLIIKTK